MSKFRSDKPAKVRPGGHNLHGCAHVVKHNVCCVDSCITGTKTLMAYRWSGEKKLSEDNLVSIKL